MPVHSLRHRRPPNSQFSCVHAFQRRDSGTEGEDRCPAGTAQGWGALARGGGGVEGRSLPDKRQRTCRGRSPRRHELPPRCILPVGQGYQIKTRPDRTRWRRELYHQTHFLFLLSGLAEVSPQSKRKCRRESVSEWGAALSPVLSRFWRSPVNLGFLCRRPW